MEASEQRWIAKVIQKKAYSIIQGTQIPKLALPSPDTSPEA